jgi:hypothetical protein
MLHRLIAMANFVNTARGLLNDDRLHATQADQCDQLVSFIKTSPADVDDRTATVAALSSAAVQQAFTEAQRRHIAEAVATSAGPVSPAGPKRETAQVHYHMQNYLTENDWSVMHTRRSDHTTKVHVLVARAHAIGLVYPTELTMAAIISILRLCGEVDDKTVHQYVQEYKRLNKLRRAPSMRTMTNFPSDPAEFTATYPMG